MRRRALVPVLTAAALAAPAVVLATPASAAAHTVRASANRQHHVSVTGRTRPGWTRLQNTGALPLFVVRPRKHAGASALDADVDRAPSPAFDRDFVVATTIDPHQVAYVLLRRGTYYVADTTHTAKRPMTTAQVATLHVSGSRTDSPLPAANRIAIDRNANVHAARVLSVHHRFVALASSASRGVDVVGVKVDPSTSQRTINAFLAHPSFAHLDQLARHPYLGLAQEAGANQTILNPYSPSKGRWMIISWAFGANGRLQTALHTGQAELVELR